MNQSNLMKEKSHDMEDLKKPCTYRRLQNKKENLNYSSRHNNYDI